MCCVIKIERGFFMNVYIFYIFAVITFFILVRETIIDIKTMYVPDNITIAIYTTSVIFLTVSWFTTHSFAMIKDGLFGFLLGFGVPFAISLFSYLLQLLAYKSQKKKDKNYNKSVESTKIEIQTTDKKEDETINPISKDTNTSKRCIIRRIIYWIFCFVFLFILSITQSSIPLLVYLGVGTLFLITIIISYEKTKKIEFPIYLAAICVLVMALCIKRDTTLISLTAGAMVVELILARIFKRFYKIETDTPNSFEEDEEKDGIEGGIGGGDILIFGALGLMFGLKGIILILLYALFSQLLIIVSYAILSSGKSFAGHVPFVPGIAIGTYLYIMGFDLLNFQQILSFFM